MPVVYIIILNWNGIEDTIECITSVRNNDYINFSIVIVDNGSDKDNFVKLKSWCQESFSTFITYTREQAEAGGISHVENMLRLKRSDEKLIFIDNNENLGFAAGNNVGIRYSLKNNVSYVLLLNNDTEVRPDFLTKMMDLYTKNPSLGSVIPQIRYHGDRDYIWNCGGRIFFGFRKYFFEKTNISMIPKLNYLTVSFATGCALLFKPNEVGLLTEKFFFGEEDFEFAYRMKKMNKKMACAMNSIIYHKVGRSIQRIDDNKAFGKIFIHYLNRFINMKQQFNNRLTWIVWRFLYSIYILHILHKILSIKESFGFMMILWQKSNSLNSVSKNCFEWAFKTWQSN